MDYTLSTERLRKKAPAPQLWPWEGAGHLFALSPPTASYFTFLQGSLGSTLAAHTAETFFGVSCKAEAKQERGRKRF